VWAAEKLDEVWLSFPDPLRVKLEGLEVGEIYKTLHYYCPEIVDRILAEVEEDKEMSRKKWALEFWKAMKNPPEEEGSEEAEPEEAEPEEVEEEEPEEPKPEEEEKSEGDGAEA
jgi:hypothetical protein